MAKKYQALPRVHLLANNFYSQANDLPELVRCDDAAMRVMTDLRKLRAITILSTDTIEAAATEMNACEVHMLLVRNDEHQIKGIITSEDLIGEKPIKIAQERKIHHDKVLVGMVMTPQDDMLALDIESLAHAKVGDIVETLHEMRKHHAIVVEYSAEKEQHIVCGLFSATQISRQLGKDITSVLGKAHDLAQLLQDLH